MKKTTQLSLIATLSMCLFACSSEDKNYLGQGQLSIEQQDYGTAVIQLKNAVRQAPEDPNARYYLALAYFNTGDASGAEKEFERALEYGYSPNDVIPYLTKLYQSKGNKKGIYKLVAKSKGVKPKVLAELKLSQAKTYVDSGEHEKAEAVLNELKAIPHSGEYGLLGLTYSFVIKNNIEAALSQLEQLLEQYPEQLEALRLKGKLLIASGKNSEALTTLQSYVELNPKDYNSQIYLAKLYLEDKQPERVLAIVNPLLETFPQAIELLSLKANTLIEQSKFDEALVVAEEVILLNSEDVPARLMAGVSAYYSNDFVTADKHLSIIAGLLPADHIGLRILADSQLKLGESVAANDTMEMLSQAVFSDGQASTNQDALLLSQLGHSLVRDGEIKKAKSVLAKLPTNLEQPESLFNLGVLKLSLNDISGIEDLELAAGKLEQNPVQLNNVLAMAYLKTAQYDKALSIADELATSESTQLEAEVLRAKVALLKGERDTATSLLNRAAQMAPQNPALQLSNIMIKPLTTETQAKERIRQLDKLLVSFPTYVPAIIQHYGVTKQYDLPRKMVTYLNDMLSDNESSRESTGLDSKLTTQLNFTLANMLLSEGQSAEAVNKLEAIRQSIESEIDGGSHLPVNKKAKHVLYQQLARAYISNNEMPKAFDIFKTWYDEAPSHGPAVIGYVRALQAQNDIGKAYQVTSKFLKKVSESNPQVTLLHLQNSLLSQKLSEFDALYETLDENVVQLPFVHGLYGHRLLIDKKPELALEHLERAYQSIPSPRVASLLATSINAVKGEQALVAFLKEHLSRHNNDELNSLRYATLMTYKNNSEAIKYYRKVLELNKNNAVASNNLAHVYMTENNLDEALEFGENALRVAPNNANILDTVGMINLKIGNTERALELISKAVLEAKPQASDEMFVNYIEVLLVNNEGKLASRKIDERSISDSRQAERLEKLKLEYLKADKKG